MNNKKLNGRVIAEIFYYIYFIVCDIFTFAALVPFYYPFSKYYHQPHPPLLWTGFVMLGLGKLFSYLKENADGERFGVTENKQN